VVRASSQEKAPPLWGGAGVGQLRFGGEAGQLLMSVS
jgi:hypothetical protein